MYDVVIIGAGIIGSFLAHDLSKYNLEVAVLDKNSDVANEASMANSAIIHSGHDPKPGTLKEKLNIRGNQMYEAICKELGVTFQRTSAFVAATNEEEMDSLKLLYKQTISRGIEASLLSGEEARRLEKNLSNEVKEVMELPSTGIVYPWEVALALMEEAVLNGVQVFLSHKVVKIIKEEDYYKITCEKKDGTEESFYTKRVLNAAGVYADDIKELVGSEEAYHITPRRGQYYVLDHMEKPIVSRVIYPMPSKAGKGVLVVPTTHNNILLGPDSLEIEDKEANNTTRDALDYVRGEVGKTVKNIPFDKVIRTFAGLRPTGDTGDFYIKEDSKLKGFIHVSCIESPGLASAPAISEYIMKNIIYLDQIAGRKEQYVKRTPYLAIHTMTDEQKNTLIKRKPEYGRIICRCEQISEGEILEAIHRPLGATTVKGVKKRVRPGMGRCQGGFCQPNIVNILARELGISPLEVPYDNADSPILVSETKEERIDEGI